MQWWAISIFILQMIKKAEHTVRVPTSEFSQTRPITCYYFTCCLLYSCIFFRSFSSFLFFPSLIDSFLKFLRFLLLVIFLSILLSFSWFPTRFFLHYFFTILEQLFLSLTSFFLSLFLSLFYPLVNYFSNITIFSDPKNHSILKFIKFGSSFINT